MNELQELLAALRTQVDKLCEVLLTEPGGFIPQLTAAIGKFQAHPGVWADHSTRVVRQGEARIGFAMSNVQRQLALLRLQRLDLVVELQEALAPLLRFSDDHRSAMRTALLIADERAPAQVERNRQMSETLSALGMRPQTAVAEFRSGVEQQVAAAPADPVTAKAKLAPVLSQMRLALGRVARVHPEIGTAFDLPAATKFAIGIKKRPTIPPTTRKSPNKKKTAKSPPRPKANSKRPKTPVKAKRSKAKR